MRTVENVFAEIDAVLTFHLLHRNHTVGGTFRECCCIRISLKASKGRQEPEIKPLLSEFFTQSPVRLSTFARQYPKDLVQKPKPSHHVIFQIPIHNLYPVDALSS